MRVKEAKDFLVQQTEEQAFLEDAPFSVIEKRMMYFTEGKEADKNPIALNEEFQLSNNDAEYEKEISALMMRAHNAYKRGS